MKVFTLGYQHLDLETYVDTLLASGVGVVLDVREVPWSHKRGFSKGPLQEAPARVGIDHFHIKSAGNPSANRKTARSTAESLEGYGRHLRANPECLEELLLQIRKAAATGRPACLTCYERAPEECHRSVLLEELTKFVPELAPVHLPLMGRLPLFE